MAENKFAEGIYFSYPNPKAPDFVKGKISIKVDEAIPFLQANTNGGGYVNLDVKESKAGKLYVSLNEYKRSKNEVDPAETVPPVEEEQFDLPF